MKTLKMWIVLALIFLVLGLIGNDDFEHMQRAEAKRTAVYVTGW